MACTLSVAFLNAQQTDVRRRTTFVELDAVVVDSDGHTVTGLTRDDFQVREDGQPVSLTSFSEVSADQSNQNDARSIVLLLGTTSPAATLDEYVMRIVRLFATRMQVADPAALGLKFNGNIFVSGSLASVARQLEPTAHRRKTVVCVGAEGACQSSLQDTKSKMNNPQWANWVETISAAARANMSYYFINPTGLAGGNSNDLGGGPVERTGGMAFRTNNFDGVVNRIWDEAGHYYLLGYEPLARLQELHSIDVGVGRKGLRVRARQYRGD